MCCVSGIVLVNVAYTVILCAILGPAEVANIGKCYNLISHNISTQFTQIDEKVVWMLYICLNKNLMIQMIVVI